MIDWARVAELRDEVGEEDFDDIVEIFLEEVDGAVSCLEDGQDTLEEKLHFLKGSALNLGFGAFAEICRQGEERAHAGYDDIDLAAVKLAYERSKARFQDEFAQQFAA